MRRPAVFSLNVHAEYACQQSGACCTAGWNIPVEAPLQERLGTAWLEPAADGACPRYERASGLCTLQRDGGESSMPESCRHFPRRALRDNRGTFVTLSHFCPTAAAMLLGSRDPLAIVESPAAFPASRHYDPLDARDVWPPLLRPDVLFDDESFATWERHMVEAVGQSADGVEPTLARLAQTAEALREWSADRGALVDWVREIVDGGDDLASNLEPARRDQLRNLYAPYTGLQAYRAVVDAVPSGLDRPSLPAVYADLDDALVAPQWESLAPLALRYLGAKAFASWTAYQSRGVRTQVAELHAAASVLRAECVRACAIRSAPLDHQLFLEAVRATDLLLMHLVERSQVMAWLGKVDTNDRVRANK